MVFAFTVLNIVNIFRSSTLKIIFLAEMEGFEPSRQLTPPGSLANSCTRPTMRHLQIVRALDQI